MPAAFIQVSPTPDVCVFRLRATFSNSGLSLRAAYICSSLSCASSCCGFFCSASFSTSSACASRPKLRYRSASASGSTSSLPATGFMSGDPAMAAAGEPTLASVGADFTGTLRSSSRTCARRRRAIQNAPPPTSSKPPKPPASTIGSCHRGHDLIDKAGLWGRRRRSFFGWRRYCFRRFGFGCFGRGRFRFGRFAFRRFRFGGFGFRRLDGGRRAFLLGTFLLGFCRLYRRLCRVFTRFRFGRLNFRWLGFRRFCFGDLV